MRSSVGYEWLKEQYDLPVINLWQSCWIDSATKGRQELDLGTRNVQLFGASYQPEGTLTAHIQFALRYEGVNLQTLSLLFDKITPQELGDWILQSPGSAYARRTCFLFEWLTGKEIQLNNPVPSKARYVDALDKGIQYAVDQPERAAKFRINNNLAGTPEFCPLVRRTEFLDEVMSKNLRAQTRETLARYGQDLLRRAAAFLYLKETQSSFELERETPSPERAQRFANLLRMADTGLPLTEERLVELQNAVVDPRFHEFTWRHQQNWLGDDLGYRKKVDFVPPRPEDLPSLMQGLLDTAAKARTVVDADETGKNSSIDAVLYAAIVAFGFVYIHPFMDGNGRIHRYLIHEVLANAGFTPRGIVLPVSAVILASLNDYVTVLEQFSKPVRERTHYMPSVPDAIASGNDAIYFRFFDATAQAEFLCSALIRTIEIDLHEEVEFIVGFDSARRELNSLLDWPGHSLDLFIRVVQQNGGALSKRKRENNFYWMKDHEIETGEAVVKEAFKLGENE